MGPGTRRDQKNERADEEVKKAAKGDSSPDEQLPIQCRGTLPISKAAAQQSFFKDLKIEAAKTFAKSPRSKKLHEIDPSGPSPRYQKITNALPRRHASLLIQLRTGHIPLNKHLHGIGKAESPICPGCRGREETVHHFLLTFPTFARQRRPLEKHMGHGARSLKVLLSNPNAFPLLFNYINSTHRLKETFGDVSLSESE